MGLFDFLTNSGQKIQPGAQIEGTQRLSPDVNAALAPEDLAFGSGNVGLLRHPPVITETPSLLSEIGQKMSNIGKPDKDGVGFWDRIYAAGAALDGGDGMGHLNGIRDRHRSAAEKAQAKQDLATKNEAFRAAFQSGRWDPQVYMDRMGPRGDAAEAFSLAKSLAPSGGVDGGTPYTRDQMTGETTWGERRPQSYAEEEAAARNDEMAAYREEMLQLRREQEQRAARQGDERIGLSRSREARVGAGGGRQSGGASGGPKPWERSY